MPHLHFQEIKVGQYKSKEPLILLERWTWMKRHCTPLARPYNSTTINQVLSKQEINEEKKRPSQPLSYSKAGDCPACYSEYMYDGCSIPVGTLGSGRDKRKLKKRRRFAKAWRSSSSVVGVGGFHNVSQQHWLLERVSRVNSKSAHSKVVQGLKEIQVTRDDWVDSS